MKRREKKLSVMDWVLVGLLDTLAGVVAGGLMAIWQLPSAYRWRGYWAIGGEWLLVIIAIIHQNPAGLLPGWMRIRKKRPMTRKFTLSG